MRATVYTIKDGQLIIKAEILINKQIGIQGIINIKETRNPISAPALSLDRLQIQYKTGSIIISPWLKHDFVSRLIRLNPDIEFIERG